MLHSHDSIDLGELINSPSPTAPISEIAQIAKKQIADEFLKDRNQQVQEAIENDDLSCFKSLGLTVEELL
jgi:hypothetical protein